MEHYRVGKTLFIEAEEGEDVLCNWWLDQTLTKVVRSTPDAKSVSIVERYPTDPSIVTWLSPVTFEDEQRMCSKWKWTRKHRGETACEDVYLPINNCYYSLKDRAKYSK